MQPFRATCRGCQRIDQVAPLEQRAPFWGRRVFVNFELGEQTDAAAWFPSDIVGVRRLTFDKLSEPRAAVEQVPQPSCRTFPLRRVTGLGLPRCSVTITSNYQQLPAIND